MSLLGGDVFVKLNYYLSTLMSFVPGPHLHLWHIFAHLVLITYCEYQGLVSGREGACNKFHQNLNYVITFELNWLLSYMVSNNEIVVSLYGN